MKPIHSLTQAELLAEHADLVRKVLNEGITENEHVRFESIKRELKRLQKANKR